MAKDALVQELVDGFDDWPAQPRPEEPASAGSCGGAARMTSELYPYDALFSPIRVNRLTLKNRIVMAPMGNIDMCEETGRPNQKMLDYFFARAKGGCGLITTGLVPVSHGIDATVTEPGGLTYFPRIDRSRTVMAGWRDLAQGVHAFGSRIFVQLTAGLGRVGNPQCLLTLKRFPASASVLPNYYMPSVPCMRLSDRRLGRIVRALGQAAADASAMGLDGVYLHGHEGYLLEQMANPAFNHRRLGRYADWRRFGLDAVREIRRRVGPDLPIMYRIDLSLALEETYGEEVLDGTYLGRMRGGRSVEQTLGYMEELVAAGVDLFDVDLGCYDNWWMPHPPASMPAGCFVPVAEAVKRRFARDGVKSNAGLPVPVVAVGKLGYPDVAERALREGACDMVMLGRPLLADPEWPNKAYAGRVDQIRPCIGCQEGCVNEFVEGGHPQCAVNPRCSFEHAMPEVPPSAASSRRVAVVGAGYIGVELAEAFVRNGRDTTLIDCAPTCLSGYYDDDFCARMADTLRQGGVQLAFGQTVQRIEGEGRVQRVVTDQGAIEADMVVFAIGFRANTKLGEGHLDLWRHGPYLVDRCQRTSDAAVFAVGDCATVYNNATRGTDYIALATNAVRTGIVAAHNACGTRLEGNGVQGSNGISIWGWNMFSTGLSLKKARALGYDAAATDREDWQKAAFIESGNYKTWLRVVYDKATRRILGAELASSQDVSMGLHMFSLAIEQGYTIDQLKLLDIFFLPHFNAPYNYITMAALGAQ